MQYTKDNITTSERFQLGVSYWQSSVESIAKAT
jgi:hypothetical protein